MQEVKCYLEHYLDDIENDIQYKIEKGYKVISASMSPIPHDSYFTALVVYEKIESEVE